MLWRPMVATTSAYSCSARWAGKGRDSAGQLPSGIMPVASLFQRPLLINIFLRIAGKLHEAHVIIIRVGRSLGHLNFGRDA